MICGLKTTWEEDTHGAETRNEVIRQLVEGGPFREVNAIFEVPVDGRFHFVKVDYDPEQGLEVSVDGEVF